MRGLNRHPAKVLLREIGAVGSNPTLSTKVIRSLAQLDRVLVFETRCRGFESLRTGQFYKKGKSYVNQC